MRLALLSSVSFIFLALAPMTAQAGFEFVPPPAAKPAPAAPNAAMPSVDNAPVAAENLDGMMAAPAPTSPAVMPKKAEPSAAVKAASMPAPKIVTEKQIILAPDEPPMAAPVVDAAPMPLVTPAPVDEPTVLGRKAIPLTPVVRESDALVLDEVPMVASASATPSVPVVPSPIAWNEKPALQSSELPPVLPPLESDSAAPVHSVASSSLEEGAPVQGFGRQVPLALALQQIVPSNYRYSFDTGVDAGQRVSWSGGKPWKLIITDLARTNNLNVDIVSNVVAFHRPTPMDIVASSSGVDTSQDTVQGMPLKLLAPSHAMTNPAPMADLPPVTTPDMKMASAEPMPIVPSMQETKTTETVQTQTVSVLPQDKPAQDMSAKKADAAVKTESKQKVKQAKFDAMMNNDTMSQTFVKEKKILLADDTADAAANDAILDAKPIAKKTAMKTTTTTVASVQTPPMNVAPASGMSETIKTETVKTENIPAHDAWTKPLPTNEIAAAPEMSAAASGPADMTTSHEWQAFKNQTLRETLTDWSQRAGVSVVWSSEYDYPLQTDVRIAANYGDAVRTLLAGFSKAQPRPIGRLFKNDKVGAQPVLVVETQRLTN